MLYFRQLLRIKRRTNLETASIETLLAEVSLPSKNLFSYVQYTALLAIFLWIDLYEEKMSIAHTTGLEYTLIGVLIFILTINTNNNSMKLIQFFNLLQIIASPILIPNTSFKINHHVFRNKTEYITEMFVPHYTISDHFPVCFTRKIIPPSQKVTILQPHIAAL